MEFAIKESAAKNAFRQKGKSNTREKLYHRLNYEKQYDDIVNLGRKENAKTTGTYARQSEKALLNRLEKLHTCCFYENMKLPMKIIYLSVI